MYILSYDADFLANVLFKSESKWLIINVRNSRFFISILDLFFQICQSEINVKFSIFQKPGCFFLANNETIFISNDIFKGFIQSMNPASKAFFKSLTFDPDFGGINSNFIRRSKYVNPGINLILFPRHFSKEISLIDVNYLRRKRFRLKINLKWIIELYLRFIPKYIKSETTMLTVGPNGVSTLTWEY